MFGGAHPRPLRFQAEENHPRFPLIKYEIRLWQKSKPKTVECLTLRIHAS